MIYHQCQITQNMSRPVVHRILAQLPLLYLLHVIRKELDRFLVNSRCQVLEIAHLLRHQMRRNVV